ncbi:MAG: copper transporter [Bacillaceae bacterium]|nr:copper transporter [Bacillaceae bacterium]
MVTHRYHITTVIAIFLSLGIGILLGAGAGQKWLSEKEQDLLNRLEMKYEEAVESNNRLQQQLEELNHKIESTNQDLIQLVIQNYSPELKGKKIAIWYENDMSGQQITDMLSRVGMDIIQYQPNLMQKGTLPVLVVGSNPPRWVETIPQQSRYHVATPPVSPIEQWNLFQQVLLLVKGSNDQHVTGE